jgi:uncharacterized Zn finger protein/biotin operon repressor
MVMGWDDFRYYPPTAPRAVAGGIKARNRRGAFAAKWWGKRWLDTLESFQIGARLSRGRAYARGGQVTSLAIEKGAISAKVQGSRPRPYVVTIKLKTFTAPEWQQILARLVEQPFLVASMLGNEMPQEMEAIFVAAKTPLFPKRQNDLVTECSCPDWSNPCKHVAAVYYLLAEAFDNDPFLLFKLRGMEREELLAHLSEDGAQEAAAIPVTPESDPVPLPIDIALFWHRTPSPVDPFRPTPPTIHAALPRRLGALPFWRGEQSVVEEMTVAYRLVSEVATNFFARLQEGLPSADNDVPSIVSAPPPPEKKEVVRVAQPRLVALKRAAEAHSTHPPGRQAALPETSQPVPGGIPMRLLAAMRSGRTYSRAALLAATGISETDWTWAIRQLKEEGFVVQEGEKRGARYRRR